MKRKFLTILLFLLVFIPQLSLAGGLVPCDGGKENPCNFNSFITLINKIITFATMELGLPIAAIMFAYAGFLMVTAGESASEARTRAKDIFLNTLKGLLIALCCWLIVHSIFQVLGYTDAGWIGL